METNLINFTTCRHFSTLDNNQQQKELTTLIIHLSVYDEEESMEENDYLRNRKLEFTRNADEIIRGQKPTVNCLAITYGNYVEKSYYK